MAEQADLLRRLKALSESDREALLAELAKSSPSAPVASASTGTPATEPRDSEAHAPHEERVTPVHAPNVIKREAGSAALIILDASNGKDDLYDLTPSGVRTFLGKLDTSASSKFTQGLRDFGAKSGDLFVMQMSHHMRFGVLRDNGVDWADNPDRTPGVAYMEPKQSPVPDWMNRYGLYKYPADKKVVLLKLHTAPYKAWAMLMTPVVKRKREFTQPSKKARSFAVGHRERSSDNSLWEVKKKSGANGALYWKHVDEEMERQRAEFFTGLGLR